MRVPAVIVSPAAAGAEIVTAPADWLVPPRSSRPPASERVAVPPPSVPGPARASVPAVTVVAPVKVLAAESVSVPGPVFAMPPAPLITPPIPRACDPVSIVTPFASETELARVTLAEAPSVVPAAETVTGPVPKAVSLPARIVPPESVVPPA